MKGNNMLHRFCLFTIGIFMSGIAFGAYEPQQIVTSEVFYNYADEVNDFDAEENQFVAEEYSEPDYQFEPVAEPVVQEVPVWPIAGTDADFKIACNDQDCPTEELKIVSKVGTNLVVENNIRTKGTGWSGGPNIVNNRPIPTGFDYECVNPAEMPLLQREMIEDDGGTVLSMSRSARRVCNSQPDSYIAFAERAGFAAESTPESEPVAVSAGAGVMSGATESIAVNTDAKANVAMNEYVDQEAPAYVQDEVRSWVVASGQTLQDVLRSWCDKEGWDLVWTTAREYPIEASAIFKGRFVDVASALVRNFERAAPAPYAKFYKGNRVVVVSTIEE